MTQHFGDIRRGTDHAWTPVKLLRRARGPLYALLLALGLIGLVASLWQWRTLSGQNAQIAKLHAGDDVGAKDASDEVRLARAAFLIARDRFNEAQAVLDAARATARPGVLARMLYNQANANVRRAFASIEAAKLDAAIPLTKLAKDSYREALRLDPGFWDAKHNYDVASRLMRDFPGYEQEGEEVPPDAEVKLWTDLPGVPQGAP